MNNIKETIRTGRNMNLTSCRVAYEIATGETLPENMPFSRAAQIAIDRLGPEAVDRLVDAVQAISGGWNFEHNPVDEYERQLSEAGKKAVEAKSKNPVRADRLRVGDYFNEKEKGRLPLFKVEKIIGRRGSKVTFMVSRRHADDRDRVSYRGQTPFSMDVRKVVCVFG